MVDWRVSTLKKLGAPVTKSNLRFLGSWQRWEGGHTNNSARFNWLNTTSGKQYPSINSVGVKRFPNYQTGINILVSTLRSGYPTLTKLLQSGNGGQAVSLPAGQADLNRWLTGNRTPGMTPYISKIAGTMGKVPVSKAQMPAKGSVSPPNALTPLSGGLTPPVAVSLSPVLPGAGLGTAPGGNNLKLGTPATVSVVNFNSPGLPPLKVHVDHGAHTGTPAEASADASQTNDIVTMARHYLGAKYVFGAAGPTNFDCSGFAQFLYGKIGKKLPRVSFDQMKAGKAVNSVTELKPGDLVFFYGGEHEGIYIGGGKFIHAPHTGDVVKISPLAGYYMQHFTTARRIV